MDNMSTMYLYVKLNRDANRFLPVESKDCMNSASYEYRNMSRMKVNLQTNIPNQKCAVCHNL